LITCVLTNTEDVNYHGPFENVNDFGRNIFIIADIGSWVVGVAFSDNGKKLAVAVHNSTVRYASIEKDEVNYE